MRHNFVEALESTGMAILADDELGVFITWNGCATFNLWQGDGPSGYQNTDVKTRYGITDHCAARQVARQWLSEIREESAA